MTRADDYQRLMADFDALSEAPPEARAARLEVLRAEAPDTARMLERLLAADARTATPLEGGLPSLGAVAAPAEVVDDRPLPAQLGEVVGAYRLESVLGRGGMGCVYVGVHEVLGRRAAVKLLYPDLCGSDEYVSRFSFEAKIVNEVHDPNVVDIFDFVVEASPRRVACVMELIEGPTLSVVLAERRLTVTQAANICLRICRALAAVHARGVIHRDLKPDNVALTAPLDSDFAHEGAIKVLDFGIAKLESRHVEHRTRSGAILGTPAYMAPEQVAAGAVTAATDVYAVGEIFYELLTGRRAFAGGGLDLMAKKMSKGPVELEWPAGTQAALVSVVQDCLQFQPAARIGLDELQRRLEAIVSGAALLDGLEVQAGLSGITLADAPTLPHDAPVQGATPVTRRSEGQLARWGLAAALALLAGAGWLGLSARLDEAPGQVTTRGVAGAGRVEAPGRVVPAVAEAPGHVVHADDLAEAPEHGAPSADLAAAPERVVPAEDLGAANERGPAVDLAEARGHLVPAEALGSPTAVVDRTPRAPIPAASTPAPAARAADPAPAAPGSAARPGAAPPAAQKTTPREPAARAPRPAVPPPSPEPVAPSAPATLALDSVPSGAVVEDAATQEVLGTTPLALEVSSERPRTLLITAHGFAPARLRVSDQTGARTVHLVPATIQTDEVKPW